MSLSRDELVKLILSNSDIKNDWRYTKYIKGFIWRGTSANAGIGDGKSLRIC